MYCKYLVKTKWCLYVCKYGCKIQKSEIVTATHELEPNQLATNAQVRTHSPTKRERESRKERVSWREGERELGRVGEREKRERRRFHRVQALLGMLWIAVCINEDQREVT